MSPGLLPKLRGNGSLRINWPVIALGGNESLRIIGPGLDGLLRLRVVQVPVEQCRICLETLPIGAEVIRRITKQLESRGHTQFF